MAQDPSVAQKIIAVCINEFDANQDDCNKFLKAVAKHFFAATGFDGKNADGILAYVQNSATGWVDLLGDPAQAIVAAKGGDFVFAGMTSTELGQTNGHVAVVVGEGGQLSGNVMVPMCYAGSLGGASAFDQKVSVTFPAKAAQSGRVRYYSKTPNIQPKNAAFDMLRSVVAKMRKSLKKQERKGRPSRGGPKAKSKIVRQRRRGSKKKK